MAMTQPTWEQYAAQNNLPAEVPPKAGEGENQTRHRWFAARQAWLQGIFDAGEDPNDYGVHNVHEQGQSEYSGWAQTMAQDPQASAWANSAVGKQWIQRYHGIPLEAYQQYQWFQKATNPNKPGYSGHMEKMSNGLYYTGGVAGAWYDQFGTRVGAGYVPGVTYTQGPLAGKDAVQGWQAAHPGKPLPQNIPQATGVTAQGAGVSGAAGGTQGVAGTPNTNISGTTGSLGETQTADYLASAQKIMEEQAALQLTAQQRELGITGVEQQRGLGSQAMLDALYGDVLGMAPDYNANPAAFSQYGAFSETPAVPGTMTYRSTGTPGVSPGSGAPDYGQGPGQGGPTGNVTVPNPIGTGGSPFPDPGGDPSQAPPGGWIGNAPGGGGAPNSQNGSGAPNENLAGVGGSVGISSMSALKGPVTGTPPPTPTPAPTSTGDVLIGGPQHGGPALPPDQYPPGSVGNAVNNPPPKVPGGTTGTGTGDHLNGPPQHGGPAQPGTYPPGSVGAAIDAGTAAKASYAAAQNPYTAGSFHQVGTGNFDPMRASTWGLIARPVQDQVEESDQEIQMIRQMMPEGGEKQAALGAAVRNRFNKISALRQGLAGQALNYFQGGTSVLGQPVQQTGAGQSLLGSETTMRGQDITSKDFQAGLANQLQIAQMGQDSSFIGSLGGLLGTVLPKLIPSDERTKEDVAPHTRGLKELRKLDPVSYKYNGKGGTEKGQPGVSVMAQQLKKVMPEAVSKIKSISMGPGDKSPKVEEHLGISPMHLLMTTVNAVKEIDKKLSKISEFAGK